MHLAMTIPRAANQLQKQRGNKNYVLTYSGTAGHEGIEGNGSADQEAKKLKKAAGGVTSDGLPFHSTRHPNISALKWGY